MNIFGDFQITTIDQKLAQVIQEALNVNGWQFGNLLLGFLAVVLTIVLCGFVGYEREKRGRSAGLRTHVLIGLTSCMVMIMSIYGFPGDAPNRDVARLAAQVVTGVGFLGAGAIVHAQGATKGLTTASTIWFVMAIGLACGSFNFILAVFSTVIVMLILLLFKKIEIGLQKNKPMICLIAKKDVPVISHVLGVANDRQLHIIEVSNDVDSERGIIEFIFKVCTYNNGPFDIQGFIDEIKNKTEAISVTILNHH